jgi:predicted N-acetyltransferase YhbS
VVHLLRESPALVPELDVVAEVDGELVGHVMSSRATVVEPATGTTRDVLTFGPLSVRPDRQARGVGADLMRHTLAVAAELGHRAVVVYGHPDYYPRFGFRPAAGFGVTAPGGATFDALMALPLVPGGLEGVTGEFHEDPVFVVDPGRVAEFDRGFPARPDAVLRPVEILEDRLPAGATEPLRARGIRHLEDLRRLSRAEVAAVTGMDDEACDVLRRVLAEHGIAWGTRRAPAWTRRPGVS